MEGEFWSGSDFAFWCLIDKNRTDHFRSVINNCVQPGDVVVDAGAGTGIFSFFSLEAGARKVYALEFDKNLSTILAKTCMQNKFRGKIELIEGDATKIELPEKADVIICEMVSTGLIDELQIPVSNNLIKFLKPAGKIIPCKIRNFTDLVYHNNVFYDHKLEIVRYEYSWHPELNSKSYSQKYLYREVDFSIVNQSRVDVSLDIEINLNGKINGIRISNETLFSDGTIFISSEAYCMPLILPFEETKVSKGDLFLLKLSYDMCHGLKTVKYSLIKIK